MQTIENLFALKDIRFTAMRLLIYKFLAQSKIAVILSDIENAFALQKAKILTLPKL